MKKTRTAIASELVADVMFASDRTCCVCNERGKAVQIHHIDENPANNSVENLAVLCLQCHDDTQIKGGFGRKLDSGLIIKYRKDWLFRVKSRREESDKIAVSKLTGITNRIKRIESLPYSEERADAILDYINSLPSLRNELRQKALPEWRSGVTARMVEASYEYIDSLQGILVTMAKFYQPGSFGDDPHIFFSELVASSFAWHRAHAEPDGPGTGGTIVSVICGNNVVSDAEKMVADMAHSLIGFDDRFNWKEWSKLWKEKNKN